MIDDWKKKWAYAERQAADSPVSNSYTYEDIKRRFVEGDFSQYVENVLPRNQYGQAMLSKHCKNCYKHQEELEVCDLCSQNWIGVRIHLASPTFEDTPFPQLQEAKQWNEILDHQCPATKRFLTHLLTIVIL